MHVTVKLHLPKKLTGIEEDELKVELPGGISLKDLYRLLGVRYPGLAKHFLSSLEKKNSMVPLLALINRKASDLSRTLEAGDDVEVFLMAAGG